MWTFDGTLVWIALRTALIYVAVLAGLRVAGKRETGQMTPLDLVLLLLLANAVQNAMTGPDTSVTGGIVAAATLLAMNTGINRLGWSRPAVRKLLGGSPRLLVRSGQVVSDNLAREHISIDDLHQAFREHGVPSLGDVALAVLEVDGSISVLRNEEMPQSMRPHHRIRLARRP